MEIICLALGLYVWAVLFWVILSWIPVGSDHPVGRLSSVLDRIIYPVLLPLRRVVPPVRLGGGLLDLSPLILIIGVQLIRNSICR